MAMTSCGVQVCLTSKGGRELLAAFSVVADDGSGQTLVIEETDLRVLVRILFRFNWLFR